VQNAAKDRLEPFLTDAARCANGVSSK